MKMAWKEMKFTSSYQEVWVSKGLSYRESTVIKEEQIQEIACNEVQRSSEKLSRRQKIKQTCIVDLMHLVNTLIHCCWRSDANTTCFGADRIKMANASITTESSIPADSDAALLNVADSVFALASDKTVANALRFKNSNDKHWLGPEFQLSPQP